ncbi:hypothetical protein ACFCZY_38635, partial [Streptomyces sp. NPDC056237]
MPKERSSEKKAARQLAAARGIPYTAALRLLREQRDTPLPVPTEADLLTALRGKVADDDPPPAVVPTEEEPPGAYCACADPACPTADGQY